MKKQWDPQRLDMAALAREGARLEGQSVLGELPRLQASCVAPAGDGAHEPVQWSAEGSLRERSGAEPQLWLHLHARGAVWQECQRCLQPVREELDVARDFRFVRSEAEADAEDLDSEEEVLALGRTLDLLQLVEDELILALPLVPRHEVCPDPLPMPAEPAQEASVPIEEHPFAKLAQLKRGKPAN